MIRRLFAGGGGDFLLCRPGAAAAATRQGGRGNLLISRLGPNRTT
jgi:hypothetical protein